MHMLIRAIAFEMSHRIGRTDGWMDELTDRQSISLSDTLFNKPGCLFKIKITILH